MKIVKLTEVIKHNGKNCKAGESLEVSESNAARLVSLKVAEIVGDAEPPKNPPPSTNPPPGQNPPPSGSTGLKDPRNIERMTMDELRAELDLLGVPHKSNMSKQDLLNLYIENKPKEGDE